MLVATASKITETIVVPTLSFKEVEPATTRERAAIVGEFEATEKAMKQGRFETYSPVWLDRRFLKAYDGATS
jgi:hypothetical protein